MVFCSFAICTAIYGSFAVIGFLMFGENTLSQITLNLPKHSVASKVALWTTVMNPLDLTLLPKIPEVFSLCYSVFSFFFLECFQVINPFTKYPYLRNLQFSRITFWS